MFLCGIDVGGTFTDVIGWEEESGELRLAKVLTMEDQSEAFVEGAELVTGGEVSGLRHVVHGTTTATNALLERKGSAVGIITTRGFRDLLELRRRDRPLSYGLRADYRPLVERRLRAEIGERVDSEGEVERAVNPEEVVATARRLFEWGAESLAVVFLNSFTNPVNEADAREALTRAFPEAFLTMSTDLLSELGEFERTVAAALNSYVGPVLRRYFAELGKKMKASGFDGSIHVIQSNGGGMGLEVTDRYAAQTLLSGPAAGVKATEALAAELEMPDVISADMGGTSFDVAVIAHGHASTSAENVIEYGLPLKLPMIDIHTIGAGGGSIAYVDRGGILQVGPQSAGANPGPAAYARGGTEATITDANVVLGRLSDAALGTERSITLDSGAAEAAVGCLAERLDASVTDTAWAIVELADEKMAGAIRRVSVEKGLDPSEFGLVSYGGAGPLHAASLTEKVGISKVVIPPFPGLHSALGCLLAPIRHDFSQGLYRELQPEMLDDIRAVFERQEAEARAVLAEEGYSDEERVFRYSLDISYQHQLYHINVPIQKYDSVEEIIASFDELYRRLYSNPLAGGTPIVVNARLTSESEPTGLTFDEVTGRSGTGRMVQSERTVFSHKGVPCETPVYQGRSRAPGELRGPAIIEEPDTTIWVPPGWRARTGHAGTLIMAVE
jgi:N-methylhydantoinase A